MLRFNFPKWIYVLQLTFSYVIAIFVWPWKMVLVSVRYFFDQMVDPSFFPKENPSFKKYFWTIFPQLGKLCVIPFPFFSPSYPPPPPPPGPARPGPAPRFKLNQPKAPRVCVCLRNQSNAFIFYRFFLLVLFSSFCSCVIVVIVFFCLFLFMRNRLWVKRKSLYKKDKNWQMIGKRRTVAIKTHQII